MLYNNFSKIEISITKIFFTQPKSTSSVDFVNETITNVTPLLPLRTSPPRVIKRKAPIPSNTQSSTGNFLQNLYYMYKLHYM